MCIRDRPIAAHKPGVSEKAAELAEKISKYARVKLDDSDNCLLYTSRCV